MSAKKISRDPPLPKYWTINEYRRENKTGDRLWFPEQSINESLSPVDPRLCPKRHGTKEAICYIEEGELIHIAHQHTVFIYALTCKHCTGTLGGGKSICPSFSAKTDKRLLICHDRKETEDPHKND
jgi:hypothetical protein